MNDSPKIRVLSAQVAAWLAGIALVTAGLFGELAGYRFEVASFEVTLIFVALLIFAPVFWFSGRNARSILSSLREWVILSTDEGKLSDHTRSWIFAVIIGLTSLGMSVWVSVKFQVAGNGASLPPAYHDEFSYLLQAKTFLTGRIWVPSHPTAPRLFDQMHVVNEGRFASRYFPGTGLWMMPFVAAGNPYWGHWLAGALASMFVFWSGCELGGRGVGLIAGLLTALSPGLALFSNLLLAHHPTLLGLTCFLYFFLRMQRTWHWGTAFASGTGLAFAMLCRPMTAAGFGLPFGIVFGWWLITGVSGNKRFELTFRLKRAACLVLPILVGLSFLYPYNKAVTGDGWTTPYSLFTNTYTPRHVYGFENVTRAEEKIATGAALTNDTFENYDRWAKNLTPELAAENVLIRFVISLQWTLNLLPLMMAALVFVIDSGQRDKRWWLIFASIVTLHAVHVPYWFVGIMNWHYVFESLPLWILIYAAASATLFQRWREAKRIWMPVWWTVFTGVALLSNLVTLTPTVPSRLDAGVSEVAFARFKYAEFHRMIQQLVQEPRALILIEHDPADVARDYVANEPGWDANILFGRFRRGQTDIDEVLRLFPDRSCYLFRVKEREFVRLKSSNR
ncbi:MAG: hypothetical protein IH899_17830 [Planctomycetes bacterium]|nr:hypothetical protein [Planctomycetota bacterium]